MAVPQTWDAARFSFSCQSIASGSYNLGRIGTNSQVRAFGNGYETPGEAYASRVSMQYSIGELDFGRGVCAIHTKKAPFQCGSIRF
ncbi:MAG: hypothetical protein DMG43_00790 [Acidobacteria bacterium]|nr:MAG: hypothetical protein DMG43_00790 [Acidobacteriota bacterium]